MTRVVLVTGANRGIGRELASQLVVRGDTVVLTARDLAKAERTAATLQQASTADLQVVREALEVNLPDDGPTGGFYRDGRPVPW